ncbi:MAG TPA: CHAT domain-containing protein [Solirubrobacteraceae bacterium]|jgi:hypothetical protein
MSKRYALDWHAGPTAQLELLNAGGDRAEERFNLRYTPPFRATLRQPFEPAPIRRTTLEKVANDLAEAFTTGTVQRSGDPVGGPSALGPATLRIVGERLFACAVVPRHIRAELRANDVFLELGIDEGLVHLPWELMHDGSDFLCNRHSMGRYVNVRQKPVSAIQREPLQPGADLGELRVLLISVPSPQPRREGTTFEPLRYVQAETEAIMTTLGQLPGVRMTLLAGRDARIDQVWDALNSEPAHHIVHFSGHAHFDTAHPSNSGLVLYDADLTAEEIVSTFGRRPPVVCFINGCESAMTADHTADSDLYGLAWAFLETGSYLVGSRWKVSDTVASDFAVAFYESLLGNGDALGHAVTAGRRAAFNTTDFGWASYILYGDPRIAFTSQRHRLPARRRGRARAAARRSPGALGAD